MRTTTQNHPPVSPTFFLHIWHLFFFFFPASLSGLAGSKSSEADAPPSSPLSRFSAAAPPTCHPKNTNVNITTTTTSRSYNISQFTVTKILWMQYLGKKNYIENDEARNYSWHFISNVNRSSYLIYRNVQISFSELISPWQSKLVTCLMTGRNCKVRILITREEQGK